VIVHADVRVLAGEDGWAESAYGPLAAETIRRMACWCQLTMMVDDPDGDPLHLGRTRRTPTWRLAETVRRRDGGCRFPGCGRTRFVEAHHVLEWEADHGPTDYENLCDLCLAHHHAVHEGGWQMTGDACAELVFTSPDGRIRLTSWPDQRPTADHGRSRPDGRPPDDDPPPQTPARRQSDEAGPPGRHPTAVTHLQESLL